MVNKEDTIMLVAALQAFFTAVDDDLDQKEKDEKIDEIFFKMQKLIDEEKEK